MTRKNYTLIVILLLITPIISSAQYKLRPAFTGLADFNKPIEMVHAGDGTNRLFILQQGGIIYVINNSPSVTLKKIFLNLTSKVSQGGEGSEIGLLGIAFHPDYENNRYFYVSYTFDSLVGGFNTYWSRIARYTASSSNPDSALASSESIILTQSQPYSNHNGGKVAFGPDGYFYISFGDGGSGGDPLGNGQNRATLLGKILRINIDSAGGGKQYSIPVTNPYYGNGSGYKEEIYSYGLRNVWKFSFDQPTGRLWAGDVGQGQYEEIDIIESAKNYGWNKMEGFHCYGTCDTTGKGFTRPVYEYSHSLGLAITGGYVYRGSLLPGLTGKYIYADYSFGSVWALTYDGINPTTNVLLQDTNFAISSFGVDENNEIYACRYSSTTGRIYKIVNTTTSALVLKASIEGFYDQGSDRLNIRDTVKAYLRQISSPFALVDSAKTVIDSLNFSGVCFFNNAATGKYYIQLKHRNGLETWSRAGGDSIKRGNSVSYDFTSAGSQAYGNNQVLIGSKYCIYSGDVFQDGSVELTDLLLTYNSASEFLSGYVVYDVNGDYLVDLNDILTVYNNSSSFVSVVRP